MNAFESAFAAWIVRHRLIVLIATAILVGLPASGLRLLYFDSSYRVFFSEDNPQLLAFEQIENTYTRDDNVFFVVAPADGAVFSNATLDAVEDFTEQAWQLPYSSRVDSISNYQFTRAEEDDLIVEDMVRDATDYDAERIALVRERVLAEPALYNRLIADDGRVTGVNVTLQLPADERTEATPKIAAAARQLAAEIEARHPGVKVYLTGMIMMDNAFFESSVNDTSVLVPIAFVLMLGLIAVLVGGFSGTAVTLVVILSSIAAAMGVFAYSGLPLTSVTTSAPIIVLTVAVANCVHVLVTYVHGLHDGAGKLAAMEESLRVNLQPVFLASATTAIGFTTMNFSEVPPFGHLGTIVSLGVLFSFVLTVTFLPAMMTLLPTRQKKLDKDDYGMMSTLADFVIARRRALLWGMTAVVILTVANLPRNELNDIFVHYFGPSIQFRSDTDFMTENLTGIYINHYSLHAAESGAISNPGFLDDIERLAQWLEAQPQVIHVDRFTTVMKRLNKNMHGDDEAFHRLPGDRGLAAQYLLLYEMSLPYGLDLNNQINVDKSSTKVSVTTQVISSRETIEFDQKVHDWIAANLTHVDAAESASTMLMFSNIGQRNIRAMLIGTTLALILISGILIVALRSLRIGAVSLLPNLVPAAVGFGLWGIFVGEVGLSLSVVSGMTFGIVIDDTVHFLSKYLRARRENKLSPPDAVRYAFRTVGKALIITTVVLVIGFSVLATSSFAINADMGLLTAVIITIALIAVFLLLPPLLMKIEENNDHATQDPVTSSDPDARAAA